MNQALHGEPGSLAVPLAGIDTALNQFWRTQAAIGEQAVLRAATLTLIMMAGDEKRYQASHQALPHVMDQHPSRIILVRMIDSEREAGVAAFISAHCRLSDQGGKQVCCEQITLHCPRREKEKLPGILLPLLLPDLPVFCWWPEAMQEDRLFLQSLWRYVDRLIVQTPTETVDWPALRHIAGQMALLNEQVRITDLTWAAITDWREALAQLFDGEDGAEMLGHLSRLVILIAGARFSAASGWLLAWLMTLLHWQPLGWVQPTFRGPQGEIAVSFQAAPDLAAQSSTVTAVEMESRLNGQAVDLWARRRKSTEIECGDSRKPAFLVRSPQADSVRLLCQELTLLQNDDLFIKICRSLS